MQLVGVGAPVFCFPVLRSLISHTFFFFLEEREVNVRDTEFI